MKNISLDDIRPDPHQFETLMTGEEALVRYDRVPDIRRKLMDNSNFAQQGWQCPICKRVYAPNTPMCWYCGGESVTTTTTTFKSTGSVDWLKKDSLTVSEDSE